MNRQVRVHWPIVMMEQSHGCDRAAEDAVFKLASQREQ